MERVAAIEHITHTIAIATAQQTAATGDIARNVAGATEAIRVVSGQIGAVTAEAHSTDVAVTDMRALAGTVSEHIAELRSVMVRIVHNTSADAEDEGGITQDLPGTLLVEGTPQPATCVVLGCTGARLHVAHALQARCNVILQLPDLPDLPATVLDDGQDVRVDFGWTADAAPAALIAWVGEREAA